MIFLYALLSLIQLNFIELDWLILWMEILRVIDQGKIFTGVELFRGYFYEEQGFPMEMEPDSLALLKKSISYLKQILC